MGAFSLIVVINLLNRPFVLTMSNVSELACVYASLILQDEGLEISATNINKIVKAAEVSVEPIWPTLFAKNMTSDSIEVLLTNVGSGAAVASGGGGGGAAAGGDSGAAPAEEKKEEKKEESEEESDDDMGFGLFD